MLVFKGIFGPLVDQINELVKRITTESDLHKKGLLEKIDRPQSLIAGKKWKRLLLLFKKYWKLLTVRINQKKDQNYSCEVDGFTFFDSPLKIILPGSSDLYLFGMKSHHSEIRLTKYLIRHVNEEDVVIDCGAHYGFYSQLFSNLVGDSGQVFSIEPSKVSFSILAQNNELKNNISSFQLAIGNVNKTDAFFEFPPQYSEYNAQSIDQYNSSKWIDDVMISNTKVDFVRLDSFLSNNQISPSFIKIDVEGGELEAIQGLGTSVDNLGTKIILEFINDGRPNESYFLASEILIAKKMLPHSIDDQGNLNAIKDIKEYFDGNGFDSDNIVFAR